jgi:signal transduction histidine kinase/ligand-binding sensor domain-containing protein
MLRGSLLATLLLIGFGIIAQTNYSVMHYTTENGLPSNGIKGVAYDQHTGYLWIGTEAGIVRFNGTQFKVFNNENTKGLASDRLDFMEKSINGAIYARDQQWNWFIIDQNQPKFLRKTKLNSIISEREYLDLYIKDDSMKQIINKVEPHNRSYTSFILIGDTSCLIQYKENRVALASKRSGLNLFDTSKDAYALFKIKNKIYAWTKNKSLCLFNPTTYTYTPVTLYNENGKPIELNMLYHQIMGGQEDDPIFLFRENEMWRIDENENKLQAVKISNQFPPQTLVRSIAFNKKNNILFISTSSKGLIILKPKQVFPKKNIPTTNQVRNSHYAQIVVDSNTILTNNSVLIGEATSKAIPIPLGEIFYGTVYTLNDSILLYLSSKSTNNENTHLCLYNYKTKTVSTLPKIRSIEVFSACSVAGKIYLNTSYGMGYIEGDSIHYYFKNKSLLNFQRKSFGMINVLPGIFWVATCDGLIEYDVNQKKQRIVLNFPGVCIRTIRSIDNDIYIGTYGKGFFIYRNKKLQAMPMDKNNYLAFSHCFMPDKEGYIWISTNRGLFKVSKTDVQSAFDNNTNSLYYHYLGKDDGMDITEMNGGCAPCAVQMNNKTMSFPTMDGLLWVNTETAGTTLPAGEIYIDNVVVDNKTYSTDSLTKKSLPTSSHSIDFHLDYQAWCNKENIYIDYKLNTSKKWIRLNNESSSIIHFENLSGGDYKLLIRKRNGFGINNYFYKEVLFSINIPFYQQWWFYFLCLIGLIGFVGLIFKLRTQQLIRQKNKLQEQINQKTRSLQLQNEVLEKSNQINSRLISIISHDIITPLKFMALGSKKLLDKKHIMPQALQEETITEITNTATELQSLSTNILNWIKYQNKHRRQQAEHFAPAEVVKQVFNILSPIAADKGIQMMSDIDEKIVCLQFREPFKILIYNLLTNAIQFSTQCIISVEAEINNADITITVNDEGVGMTPDQIQNILSDEFIISSVNVDNKKGNGLGYLIIKDLLKLLLGKLSIQSEKGKGTAVSFTVPQNLPNS